jgi:uncharacterized repeat protein (TIGR03803 family)
MSRVQDLFSPKCPTAIFIAILMLVSSVLAVGQTETVIHRFGGNRDGLDPRGGLIADSVGNFYGTTCGGGSGHNGTVFQLAVQGGRWTKNLLYAFTGASDGSCPYGELVFDQAGNLYGAAFSGDGLSDTVFQLQPSTQGNPWTESVIYSFEASAELTDGLVFDQAGNLYGATYYGGEKGKGQVFQLTPSQGGVWTETAIHSFTGPADGSNPLAGPIIGKSGNLYGVLQQGPGTHYDGAVYEMKAPSTQAGGWTEHVLYNFKGGNDGAEPSGRLILDWKGNLDGVTRLGSPSNQGTVFQLTLQNDSWTEAVLYSFCTQSGCSDGAQPQAGVLVDGKGNLYGTTLYGGTGGACQNSYSCGTVFQLTPPTMQGDPWTQTVLHSFTGNGGDGNMPFAGLVHGKTGSLWGTTPTGGGKTAPPCSGSGGCGTVFNVRR